jgi:hypothetical protein
MLLWKRHRFVAIIVMSDLLPLARVGKDSRVDARMQMKKEGVGQDPLDVVSNSQGCHVSQRFARREEIGIGGGVEDQSGKCRLAALDHDAWLVAWSHGKMFGLAFAHFGHETGEHFGVARERIGGLTGCE